MVNKEYALAYIQSHKKENKYRIARALKIRRHELTEALVDLEQEGKIEIKGGKICLAKEKVPTHAAGAIEAIKESEKGKKIEELEEWVNSILTSIKEAIERSLRER